MTETINEKQKQNFCLCGCGQVTNIFRGKSNKFINHHASRAYKNNSILYTRIDSRGYILIRRPNHPLANVNGYVFYHRLVYEKHYNCNLLPYSVIHHRDRNKLNNAVENLEPLYNFQHGIHNKKDISARICLLCNSNITYKDKRGVYTWLKYKNGFVCYSCYNKRRKRLARGLRELSIMINHA
jgi:hypothetical protein